LRPRNELSTLKHLPLVLAATGAFIVPALWSYGVHEAPMPRLGPQDGAAGRSRACHHATNFMSSAGTKPLDHAGSDAVIVPDASSAPATCSGSAAMVAEALNACW
jgi:hypothetical protein